MYHVDAIEYAGDDRLDKVVMPNGKYLLTLSAEDIPVTDLGVGDFFYSFRNSFRGILDSLNIQLKFDFSLSETFIGEPAIIYNLLDDLVNNSFRAKAKVFQIQVTDVGDRISVVVSDDGVGINCQHIKDKLFNSIVSTSTGGSGISLYMNGKPQLRKMGADIKYKGVGIDGKGASFELTFLKRMPT